MRRRCRSSSSGDGRAAFLSSGASRAERARGGVCMCELESVLIGDHELTLRPSKYPWDEARRRDEGHVPPSGVAVHYPDQFLAGRPQQHLLA